MAQVEAAETARPECFPPGDETKIRVRESGGKKKEKSMGTVALGTSWQAALLGLQHLNKEEKQHEHEHDHDPAYVYVHVLLVPVCFQQKKNKKKKATDQSVDAALGQEEIDGETRRSEEKAGKEALPPSTKAGLF